MRLSTENGWIYSFSDELALRWDDYVDCRKRLLLEAPFLKNVLGENHNIRILDAAMGLGCESIYLAKEGYNNICGNEIDSRLLLQANRKAERLHVPLPTSQYYWEELADRYVPESFDVILMLGNSLCLINNPKTQLLICNNIFNILSKNGKFIVDQRNFNYMFDERNRILNGEYKYSAKYMYCESSIRGIPIIIEKGRVRLECIDKKTKDILGFFDMFPFLDDELERLTIAAGFKDIQTYYDFKISKKNPWEFKTLVCHKNNLR